MNAKTQRREATHERILDTAARAIRRTGYQGTGVADLMKEAGLTHGGFYAHFSSRNAMLAEAIQRAGEQSAARLAANAARRRARGASPLRAMVEVYLGNTHLAEAEQGCALAALLSEMPRQPDEVRQASAARVQRFIDSVRAALPDDAPPERAAAIAAAMVGGLQLARALGDNAQGRAVLAATRQALLAEDDSATAPQRRATGTTPPDAG